MSEERASCLISSKSNAAETKHDEEQDGAQYIPAEASVSFSFGTVAQKTVKFSAQPQASVSRIKELKKIKQRAHKIQNKAKLERHTML